MKKRKVRTLKCGLQLSTTTTKPSNNHSIERLTNVRISLIGLF